MHPMISPKLSRRKLGLCLTLLAHGAFAGDFDKAEGDFLSELPLVLTASRILQSPLDAPAPVTIIDRETILDSGFTEIHDIFRLVPGFLVADWPNGSPVVVNQGMGDAHSRRLLVLLDGRALYDPFQGGVDWQDLPLRMEDIERIEVVRGPNPASYGANAFQGVINIITQSPLGENEQGLVMRAGKRDIGDLYAYLARGDGNIDWRISASARQATNFRDLGGAREENEAIKRQAFNGQLKWNLSPSDELSFQLGLSNGDNEIGQVGEASDPARTETVRNTFFDVGWKRFYADNSEISLRYYHYGRSTQDQYNVYQTYVPPVGSPPSPASLSIQGDIEVRRDDLELQQIHTWSDSLTSLWGLGLRHDAAESPGSLTGLGSVGGWQWQAFGNLDWKASPDWLVHTGGMLEKHYNTDLLFSPRLALNYLVSPAQSLRFSAGRGYRAPTIRESDAREMVTWSGGVADLDFYAYRNLEPEKLDYAELGYIAYLQPMGLRLDARMYLNKYSNFIDEQSCFLDPETLSTVPTPGFNCAFPPPEGYERPLGYTGKPWLYSPYPGNTQYQTDSLYTSARFGHYKSFYFLNAGNIRVQGGDLGLDWKHPAWGRFRISHAITRINSSGPNSNPERDKDMETSAPQHATSLLWSKRFSHGLRVSLGGYWVGEMIWPNDGDIQPAYRRFDLNIGKTLKLFGKHDELSLTVQNFNTEHSEFREEFRVERRTILTYRVNL